MDSSTPGQPDEEADDGFDFDFASYLAEDVAGDGGYHEGAYYEEEDLRAILRSEAMKTFIGENREFMISRGVDADQMLAQMEDKLEAFKEASRRHREAEDVSLLQAEKVAGASRTLTMQLCRNLIALKSNYYERLAALPVGERAGFIEMVDHLQGGLRRFVPNLPLEDVATLRAEGWQDEWLEG